MRTLLLAATAGIALGGCGSSTPASSPTPPRATATPLPSATAGPATPTPAPPNAGATGGFGDTATNPDSQYVCAAKATENSEVIAYTTVSGPDTTGSTGVCTAMEQGSQGAWSEVSAISGGSFETAPICWVTAANGQVTQRVYTAVPNGDDQATMVLCDDLFSGAGVTPQGTS
ncbi:MAG TPA: hypothetical protein VND88_06335 [Candidatus Acidoferrales bacterium]|nr:hypothetical protein [Candidatus Acidoferrales bacterium]